MAKPTEKNHTGVESYDHDAVARLPEYQLAREALDALVRAINDAEAGVEQPEFLTMAEQMAASLTYRDSSGHERDACRGADGIYPYRVVIDDDGERLRGWYHCPY